MNIQVDIHPNISELIKKFSYGPAPEFGKIMLPIMIRCDYSNGKWGKLKLIPYGPLEIDPAAKVLHYAQEIFEGMKAYKNESGKALLFRPLENARRFNRSAERLAMPTVPEDLFLESLKVLVQHSITQIPQDFASALYLRPFMIGTEPALGVRPANQYQYFVIASPAKDYFKKKNVKVYVERGSFRASPAGTGYVKAGGNYGASLRSYIKTQEQGCDQTLWLDSTSSSIVEELSGMNFAAIIRGRLVTPALTDTILPGITRDSLLKIATSINIEVSEEKIKIDNLLQQIQTGDCTEAFACGTASVVTPIELIHDRGDDYRLKKPEGEVSLKLRDELLKIQHGQSNKFPQWNCFVD